MSVISGAPEEHTNVTKATNELKPAVTAPQTRYVGGDKVENHKTRGPDLMGWEYWLFSDYIFFKNAVTNVMLLSKRGRKSLKSSQQQRHPFQVLPIVWRAVWRANVTIHTLSVLRTWLEYYMVGCGIGLDWYKYRSCIAFSAFGTTKDRTSGGILSYLCLPEHTWQIPNQFWPNWSCAVCYTISPPNNLIDLHSIHSLKRNFPKNAWTFGNFSDSTC